MSSSASIKVAIVGNCQVRPLAELLSKSSDVNNDIKQIIVHLSSDDSAETNYEMLNDADLILCQLVADNYPVKHVRTTEIKQQFSEKVVVWPNVFFHGQNPDLVYATAENNKKVIGPIDVYHSRSLIELWRNGAKSNDVGQDCYVSSVFSANVITQYVEKSFQDLALREAKTDIKMCPFIRDNWQSKKLFHTFNHPTSFTLFSLAEQIMEHVGLNKKDDDFEVSNFQDWLGTIQPPFESAIADSLGLSFESTPTIAGVVVHDNHLSVDSGNYRQYTFSEFVDSAFKCYDAQREHMGNLRFTPSVRN